MTSSNQNYFNRYLTKKNIKEITISQLKIIGSLVGMGMLFFLLSIPIGMYLDPIWFDLWLFAPSYMLIILCGLIIIKGQRR